MCVSVIVSGRSQISVTNALQAFLPKTDNGPDGPLTNGAPSGPLVSSLPVAAFRGAVGDTPSIMGAHNSSQNTISSRMVKPLWPFRATLYKDSQAYNVNLKMVFVRYVSPGRSTVDGKAGWFGESG